MRTAPIIAFFFFLMSGLAQAVLADDAEVLAALVDDFLAGASVNDPDTHRSFWSEDLVYTGSAGARYGKAKILAGLGAPAADAAPGPVYTSDQMQIRSLGPDAAVVTFRLVATAPDGAVDYYFNTGVFQREAGQWRASVWQATRAAP